jgi:hypothetical protein
MKTWLLILSLSIFVVSCGSSKKDKRSAQVDADAQGTKMQTLSENDVQNTTNDWPDANKEVLNQLTAKYGQPNEATPSMVIWRENGPWQRTILYRNPGNDFLEQTVNMDVPPERLGDISLFNRSISIDQNQNEVTSRSNREEMNFLTMNLTKEIIDGRMGAMEARRQYSSVKDSMGRSQYMDSLNFQSESEAQEESPEVE